MIDGLDHYEAYYGDKLWNLLPAVYRAEDTDNFSSNGPLREIVNRIGAQAAILRRSMDRMWEDQSIETCDDWVVPYLGDLLATNLVINLDARGQRRDVAKTIYYRRRKGTLAILEEIASDITGWDAKIVEFFRRLGRTRHSLDPAIGLPLTKDDEIVTLQRAENLVGSTTRTAIGGLADLRNGYGASKATSAFDEFFHTADFRRGRGNVGWYNIPRLGVFLWRLKSFPTNISGAQLVDHFITTPVPMGERCPDWYTFDPTGRDIPLFARASRTRTANAYGSNWTSPVEPQLPTPISQLLLDANTKLPAKDQVVRLYPDSLSILSTPRPILDTDVVSADRLKIRPEQGRFEFIESPPAASPPAVWVSYHYGFSSEIGAGPYERRIGRKAPPTPNPPKLVTGGGDLAAANAVPPAGTLTLGDSLTYTGVNDILVQKPLTVRAEIKQRPLIRLPQAPVGLSTEWRLTGENESCLVLDGIFISGGDVVLQGDFACVTFTCCTLDPGSVGNSASVASPPAIFAVAADGRDLVPTRLWIEGTIGTLTIERSVIGPVLTRADGRVETLTITDSIVQAIPHSVPDVLSSPPDASPPESAFEPPTSPALLLADGDVSLSRCTVLGAVQVHRLEASECILQEVATVEDAQHGCVRFTAWADGSLLPRKYESVQISSKATLFTSTDFGQPGYGQLLATADAAILPGSDPTGAPQKTISEGAEDGSEMGAFAREKNPIKERGLLIKYQEFLPVGVVPVVIHVT